jgi:hypothetical protein
MKQEQADVVVVAMIDKNIEAKATTTKFSLF